MTDANADCPARDSDSDWTVFLVFLWLGLTSFGGPLAHLGYFRDEFVVRRRWLSERSYSDLIALCQFLPGPVSSQVGIAVGLTRGGLRGALAAWCGFTLLSAVALVLFARAASWGMTWLPDVVHGLMLVAVAVVAQAVWGMARALCPDAPRIAIALAAAAIVLLRPDAWGQVGVIVLGGIVGAMFFRRAASPLHDALPMRLSRRFGAVSLATILRTAAGLACGRMALACAGADDLLRVLPRRFAGVRRWPCRAARCCRRP